MKKILIFTILVAIAVVGCTTTQKGAAVGAAGGSVLGGIIGHQSDHGVAGAAIGAGAGGIAGALIGDKMETKFCPICGATYPNDTQFCPKDGAELKVRQK